MACSPFRCEGDSSCSDTDCPGQSCFWLKPEEKPNEVFWEVAMTWWERTLIGLGALALGGFFVFAYYAVPILR